VRSPDAASPHPHDVTIMGKVKQVMVKLTIKIAE